MVASVATGMALSIPYLFSIFPFQSEKILVTPIARNPWIVFSSYVFMVPLVVLGARNLIRLKDDALIFIAGSLGGIIIAALFLVLPGDNQYKFVQLLAIPCGLLSAAMFVGDEFARARKALLSLFLIFVVINMSIVAYAYATSRWWRDNNYAGESFHTNPSTPDMGGAAFYRWIRDYTPKNAVLVTPLHPGKLALFTERSLVCTFNNWVSLGHKGDKDRRLLVSRIFSDSQFAPSDIDNLKRLKRPVYFVLTPFNPDLEALLGKFEYGNPAIYLVYSNANGYRLYYLAGT
jgi:hypothetical protein